MVSYAANVKNLVTPESLIRQAVRVSEIPADELKIDDKQEAWVLLDKLAAQIHPVTASTLRIAETLEHDQTIRPGLWRCFWLDPMPRATVRRSVNALFCWLILTMIIQVYAAIGGAFIKDIDALQAEKVNNENHSLALNADYVALIRWNCLWRLPLRPIFNDPIGCSDRVLSQQLSDQEKVAEDTVARRALEVLNFYILPMLYGLFGASAFVLRSLNVYIDSTTFDARAISRYRLRRALGGALGITAGLFYTPDTASAHGVSLSLVAVAFLSGYNVEVFLVIFDGIVSSLRRWIGAVSKSESASAQSASS